MKILITGAGGFAGSHLIELLHQRNPDAELHGTFFAGASENSPQFVIPHVLDLCNLDAVVTTLQTSQPDQIYHLAAWANVGASHQKDYAWKVFENNIRGQLNLFLACIELKILPRVLAVTSGEIYDTSNAHTEPITEQTPLKPANPYGVSKATQDLLAQQYFLSHQLPIVRARPFNHTGPRQRLGFVVPDFANQVAEIEANLRAPVMKVGSLDSERDFTDVRDVVQAYYALMNHGEAGEAYNIASQRPITIQSILDYLLSLSDAEITVTTDPTLIRPGAKPKSWGNTQKLREATQWRPTYDIHTTLQDVLNDYRQQVHKRMSQSS